MDALFVYVTASTRAEAEAIGREVVTERLAACANVIDGMTSIYRWEGVVEEAKEAVLILKSTADRIDRLTRRIAELHSYDMPCIVALPITGGNPAYLHWIAAQTT